MIDFSEISKHYEKTSLVQNSAGDILIKLLGIQPTDDVLDLACGTGHLTNKMQKISNGRIIGIDSADGMIKKATKLYGQNRIEFRLCKAEEIDFQEEFDVIFCNSAFQWFKLPKQIIKKCFQALRKNGVIGIQAPAKQIYSPNFIKAIKQVQNNRRTKNIVSHFHSPWLFMESSDEYKSLFESIGFHVTYAKIDKVVSSHTPEEIYKIFDSGASAGYLNQEYYDIQLTSKYIAYFREIARNVFTKQADKRGKVKLLFFRIYLVAKKGG